MNSEDLQEYLKAQREMIAELTIQHQKVIEDSTKRLEDMIAKAATVTQAPETQAQSAWITGNDGERFLMLNESAAQQFDQLFEKFKEVIELLAKKAG